MKKYYKFISSIIFVLTVLLCLIECKDIENGVLTNPHNVIDKYGVKRNYTLYLPANIKESVPMIIYFHGVRSEKFRTIAVLKGYSGSPLIETGLIRFCKIKRIALLEILPSYSYKFMNVKAHGWSPFVKEIDGVEKCIDSVLENYRIDKNSVYISGISAGAVLAHHLANRRPKKYSAVLSHSQAYINEGNDLLIPSQNSNKFGVVFCYTKGDYDNLKVLCESSFNIYKKRGYRVIILRNLPPSNHKWSTTSNGRFWRSLLKVSR